jgi:hypothetical protein
VLFKHAAHGGLLVGQLAAHGFELELPRQRAHGVDKGRGVRLLPASIRELFMMPR